MNSLPNDQYFNPGDKVMRVSRGNPFRPGFFIQAPKDALEGVVYCVSACWKSKQAWNLVDFVGFPPELDSNGNQRGFIAANFRRVEEIKLCVNAVHTTKQPQTEPLIAA